MSKKEDDLLDCLYCGEEKIIRADCFPCKCPMCGSKLTGNMQGMTIDQLFKAAEENGYNISIKAIKKPMIEYTLAS